MTPTATEIPMPVSMELNQSPVAILASEMAREGSELVSVAVRSDAPCHPPHEVPDFPSRIGGPDDVFGHAFSDAEDLVEQAPGKKEIGVGANSMIPGDRLRDPLTNCDSLPRGATR